MKYNKVFNAFILIFGVLCVVYYIGMGLAVRFGQSLLFIWPLIGAVCIARYFLVRRVLRTGRPLPAPRWLLVAFRACVAAFLAVFAFAEVFICSGAFEEPPAGLDCVIVLGARVNGRVPSGALSQRIDTAYKYLEANPDAVCVASGGQGSDEEISEGSCIRDSLISLGIAPERIRAEERSTDTVTNLTGSFPLMPEGTRSVGIVTNDFHIFRALSTARRLSDLSFYGVPAQSTAYGFLHYAVREFFALAAGTVQGELSFA